MVQSLRSAGPAPRWLSSFVLAMALFVLLLDWLTGPNIHFPILFVLPVLLAAWFGWRNLAGVLALLLPLARAGLEAQVWRSDSLLVASVNGITHLIVLLLLALLGDMAGRYVRQLRLRFAAIVETAEEAIISLDLDGTIQSWNADAERLFGYRADEIVGRPVTLLAAPGRVDEVQASLARLAHGERLPSYETVRRHKDGTLVDVSVIGFPILHDDGKTGGAMEIIHDITKRKNSENAAAEALALYKTLVEAEHDGIVYNDMDGNILSVNARFAELLGFASVEELLVSGLTTFDLLAPEERESARDKAAPMFETNLIRNVEMKILRRDGSQFYAELNTTIVRDEQLAPKTLVTFVRDISERKRAEVELHESEARLRAITENVPDIIFTVDRQLRIQFINHVPTGLSVERALGTSCLEYVAPDDRATVETAIQHVFETGQLTSYEILARGPKDTLSWYATRLAPIDLGAGEKHVLLITEDITARKQAEEQQHQLDAKFQQAQKLESLGILAGGIAHDFNNLLTGILGYADLASLELPPGSPAHDLIAEAMNGTRRAAELTAQMLAYSGKGRFVVEPLDLSALIEGITRLLGISISKKCVLKYDLVPDLPNIAADATQMRQVVMNLVINASEAIGERSGLISIATGAMHCDHTYLSETYLDEDLPEGLYVYVEVSDNGTGMTEETRARLFEPFFTTKFTGRGLGLAAVLGIVRGHKGALKVYSEPGRGTTFKALFPATEMPSAALENSRGPATEWRGSGTVLLIDDEETVRGLVRRMLERMGFTVLTAADGREALELFRANTAQIRLMVLDMTMPHMDGEETFRELRRIRDDLIIILSSGYNEQTATSRFAGKGLAAFIQKPYRFEELRAVVRKALASEDSGKN